MFCLYFVDFVGQVTGFLNNRLHTVKEEENNVYNFDDKGRGDDKLPGTHGFAVDVHGGLLPGAVQMLRQEWIAKQKHLNLETPT